MSSFNPFKYQQPKKGVTFKGGLGTKKKPIPLPTPINEIVPLSTAYTTPYDYLFLCCYLYGSRVTEACKLRKSSFTVNKDENSKDVLVVWHPTLKNRQMPFRRLPAILSGRDLSPFQQEEAAIAKHLHEYAQSCEDHLFPDVNRWKAYQRFKTQTIDIMGIQTTPEPAMVDLPEFKLHPHYLRHCRLSHLVDEYPGVFDSIALMQYAGWTDPRPASIYLQLDWHYLARAMSGKGSATPANPTKKRDEEDPQVSSADAAADGGALHGSHPPTETTEAKKK